MDSQRCSAKLINFRTLNIILILSVYTGCQYACIKATMTHPNNLEAACERLKMLCLDYQIHLEHEIYEEAGSTVSIHTTTDEIYAAIEKNKHGNECLKVTGFSIGKHSQGEISEKKLKRIELLIQKHDTIETLRRTLHHDPFWSDGDPSNKLMEFNKALSQNNAKNVIAAHRDSYGNRFLQAIAYIVSSVFVGAGLFYSFYHKGSCAFWKSHGEVTLDKMNHLLEPITATINQNQITSP